MDLTLPSVSEAVAQLALEPDPEQLRAAILELAGAYARLRHGPQPFEAGLSPVPVSGKVLGEAEMRSLVDSALDFWLTTGRFNDAFEAKLSAFIGVRHALTTNSGSSANLLALSCLTSSKLGARQLQPGLSTTALVG